MFAARQFVNHGHVKVNGRKVNIASYQLKVGDLIEVKDSSKHLLSSSKRASFPSATCLISWKSITPR